MANVPRGQKTRPWWCGCPVLFCGLCYDFEAGEEQEARLGTPYRPMASEPRPLPVSCRPRLNALPLPMSQPASQSVKTPKNDVISASQPQTTVSRPSTATNMKGDRGGPIVNSGGSFKRMLAKPTPDVRTLYEFGSILGRGTTSIVREVTERTKKEAFACKSISKVKMSTPQHLEDVKREIEVLFHLRGHPDVVELHGVYEDRNNIHLIMDLCTGGELFDHSFVTGSYTENDARGAIRAILKIVVHCHKMGVIHRDIKPENFLWTDGTFTSLKAIDFGLSTFYRRGVIFNDLVGSKYYVAPEVLRRSHTNSADIWSCGIVLYMLLAGCPPFLGDSLHEVFDNIIKENVDFESPPWPKISVAGKDFIQKMLIHDPNKRWWVNVDGVAPNEIIPGVRSHLREFAGMDRFEQIARKIIVQNLPMNEINELSSAIKEIDADGNGNVSTDELREACFGKRGKMPEEEFEKILKAADIDGNGTIRYKEFLSVALSAATIAKGENLIRAFEHFDKNGSGFISRAELREAMEDYGSVENLDQIIDDADRNRNGMIDYEEFRHVILGY